MDGTLLIILLAVLFLVFVIGFVPADEQPNLSNNQKVLHRTTARMEQHRWEANQALRQESERFRRDLLELYVQSTKGRVEISGKHNQEN